MTTPTERVLGIGGLFFRSDDRKELTQWYQGHLGIDQPSWQQPAGPTAVNPFAMEADYFFGSKQQGWMVNVLVRSPDAMVAQLQKADIEVKVDPEKYPYGRFARLHDPKSNPIALWESSSPAQPVARELNVRESQTPGRRVRRRGHTDETRVDDYWRQ